MFPPLSLLFFLSLSSFQTERYRTSGPRVRHPLIWHPLPFCVCVSAPYQHISSKDDMEAANNEEENAASASLTPFFYDPPAR